MNAILQVALLADTIKAQPSGGNAPPPESLSMPPDALRVWRQLLLCFLFWSSRNMALSSNHAKKALGLLQKAHMELMKNPKAQKLDKVEAVLPNGLLAIIFNRIISDYTGTQPGLVDSYWEYFDNLEIKLGKEPLNRHNQVKISAFITEVRIVSDSLERQYAMIDRLDDEFARDENFGEESVGSIRPLNPALLLLREALEELQGKMTSIEELLENAQELLELNEEIIRHNKDRQEAAIYTFTIVTIIFLPISTVASVMGMNTKDIRNMGETQWLFWTVALPLTAIVIILSLFAAGIFTWPFKKVENQIWSETTVGPTQRRRRRSRRERSGSSDGSTSTLADD